MAHPTYRNLTLGKGCAMLDVEEDGICNMESLHVSPSFSVYDGLLSFERLRITPTLRRSFLIPER